jgi:hypothetical protein
MKTMPAARTRTHVGDRSRHTSTIVNGSSSVRHFSDVGMNASRPPRQQAGAGARERRAFNHSLSAVTVNEQLRPEGREACTPKLVH